MLKFIRHSWSVLLNNKNKINFYNIYQYIIGNFMYLVYRKYPKLIPTFLFEQYENRIKLMDKKCFEEGQCKYCGCETLALQFAPKQCEGKEYPKLMWKKQWKIYKLLKTLEK